MEVQPTIDAERVYMERAIELAQQCNAEDHRHHPKVAALVVRDGKVLHEAYRGQNGPGEHAEFTVLEKLLKDQLVAGSTVYTTLEPCTTRNHPKLPCAQRLIERKVSRVVVGMLDPNPNILGRGILQLRQAGISVGLFPSDLMSKLEELNREFIRSHPLPPAITDELLRSLAERSLDDWYISLNRMYWNRNFQRSDSAIFTHLVEVIGNLSVVVSKKPQGLTASEREAFFFRYMAKAIAWWLALCGKAGIKSVGELLWRKFPGVCPYCHKNPHSAEECREQKAAHRGPRWSDLARIAIDRREQCPRAVSDWQKMFAEIYGASDTDDLSKVFAKLTEEVGELAEALRVFRAAPGYFLSEAADVFAWLMKLVNLMEVEFHVSKKERGAGLSKIMAESYPARCRDCNASMCSCPPILASTIGRIAHEVPNDFASYDKAGSFVAAEKLPDLFGITR